MRDHPRMTSRRLRAALAFRARRARADALDALDRVRGGGDPLTPPRRLRTGDYSDFERLGREFLDLFVRLGGLRPDHSVLDIGCGPGRIAVPLTGCLSTRGGYAGFDIVGEEVAWCRSHITPRFPNFRFDRVDVHNARYNPNGAVAPEEFRFPYADESFDFVFATSVFTHMLGPEVEHYLGELARVLRPSGRALLTWFLLTDESRAFIASGSGRFSFAHDIGAAAVDDPASPEAAVAYPEEWVAGRIAARGLRIVSTHPGGWCRHPDPATWQDVVVVTRA
jgi:SAM-dependent methyltransferase